MSAKTDYVQKKKSYINHKIKDSFCKMLERLSIKPEILDLFEVMFVKLYEQHKKSKLFGDDRYRAGV